jgi:nicotianamine synthase
VRAWGWTAWEALRAFPYFRNYMDLSRLEISALAAVRGSAIGSLAFVGSGPLPLTSICLSTLLSPAPRRIHNVDSCPRAIALSRELCDRLRVPLTFEHADARDVVLDAFDVVVLAGLVGADADEKARILGNVVRSCRQDALLVLRSAHGLRTLLYQELDVARLRALGLDVLLVVNPWNDVVNSVVVCRVAARARL